MNEPLFSACRLAIEYGATMDSRLTDKVIADAYDELARAGGRVAELERERDEALRHLREFNHVEGEPLDDVAAVAASAYGFLVHRSKSLEARVAEVERERDETRASLHRCREDFHAKARAERMTPEERSESARKAAQARWRAADAASAPAPPEEPR